MRRSLFILAIVSLICSGCGFTRIVTVSPTVSTYGTYSTAVTIPRTHAITTTARVVAADNDICLDLDLQAVGAAFAQSSDIQEFERLLNNASYILSNLDLNRDGFVDYLRVVESMEGTTHVFIIQAVLGDNIYQDVATIVAEVPSINVAHVQIIGAPYIYGPRYIIEPVFISTPSIFAHLMRRAYEPWISPWHWNHYPSYYRHPAPIFATHYQAYISTFMHNHRYCHEIRIVHEYHYVDYDRVSRPYQRNDYGSQHPERSFTERTANAPERIAATNSGREFNAQNIRESQAAATTTRTTSTRATTGTRTATAATTGATRSSSASTGTTRAASTGTASRAAQSEAASTSGQTTVRSRVSTSGTQNTRISTVTPSGTKSTNRASGSSSSVSRSSSSASSSASRSSSSSSSSRSASSSSASSSSPSRSSSTGSSSSRSTSSSSPTRR